MWSKIGTTKLAFSSNINSRVKQLYGKLPVIQITKYELYNGSFIVVKDFKLLEIFDSLLGCPVYLTEQDYERLKSVSKPNARLAQTPSMVKKVLSEKHVTDVNNLKKPASHVQGKRNVGK